MNWKNKYFLEDYRNHSFFFAEDFCVFVYFWLCWVSVAACKLSLVAESRGSSPLWCVGFLLLWLLLLCSAGSRCPGSVVVAHGPHCSEVRGIFPEQGSNPCVLHWQVDSQPPDHQGRPKSILSLTILKLFSEEVWAQCCACKNTLIK